MSEPSGNNWEKSTTPTKNQKSTRGGFPFVWVALCLWLCATAQAALQLPLHPPMDGYQVVDAFPGLTFDQPVHVGAPPGETNGLFVVERPGKVVVLTNLANPSPSLFLDLGPNVRSASDNDVGAGLLGMAFHPGFATNGFVYVYRTQAPTDTNLLGVLYLLSRFTISITNRWTADPESELVIISQLSGGTAHSGGQVLFGPDGYLYLTVGYGTPMGNDILGNPTVLERGFFGGIFRIDVDKRPGNLLPNPHPAVTPNYLVPNDNPFVGLASYQGQPVDPSRLRTEFFAVGLRNPWQMAFHPLTKVIVASDTGADRIEEINLIVKGGDYGWPFVEGLLEMDLIHSAPPQFEFVKPLLGYRHGNQTNEGNAVVGGVFYFGSKIPQLRGKYLFGDFRRGHIWTLENDGLNFSTNFVRIGCSPELTSFALDPRDGEILISNMGNGQIQRLIYTPAAQAPPFPMTLAETGAFTDLATLSTDPSLVEFQINHPFFSDGALKRRWFMTPSKIRFDDGTNYGTFPAGAVWMKHFDMEMIKGDVASRRRLETRFIVKTNSGVYGVTYRWNPAGTSATLVPEEGMDEELSIMEDGVARSQMWRYPGRAECRSCHTDAGGQALGFNVAQLNRTVNGQNQLEKFAAQGHVNLQITNLAQAPALAAMNDETRNLGERFKSYAAANCASCHYGFNINAQWDARIETPLADMHVLGSGLIASNFEDSSILHRVSVTDAFRMPPLGRLTVDTNAVAFLKRWMNSFPRAPWLQTNIGIPPFEGMATVEPDKITVTGAGAGLASAGDQGFFFAVPATNNVTVSVRLLQQDGAPGAGAAGLMLRAANSPAASFAFAGHTVSRRTSFQVRPDEQADLIGYPDQPVADAMWYRLEKSGSVVTVRSSTDGVDWASQPGVSVNFPEVFFAGLFSANSSGNSPNNARFDRFSAISVALGATDDDVFIAGAGIKLKATVHAFQDVPSKVEYFVDNAKIGEGFAPDYAVDWTNALAGQHTLHAKLTVASGATVPSLPATVNVTLPEPKVLSRSSSQPPGGNWIGAAGAHGFLAPGVGTNLSAFVKIDGPTAPVIHWNSPSSDARVLQPLSGVGAGAYAWQAPVLQFRLTLTDGLPHRVRLYSLDFERVGAIQTVEFLDPATGAVLASQTLSDFGDGIYSNWRVRGQVDVRVTSLGASPAMLSGIFIDPTAATAPTIRLLSPVAAQSASVRTPPLFEADATDADGEIPVVSFFANGAKIGELTGPPYRCAWSNAWSGAYTVYARAVDDFGLASETPPIQVTLLTPEALAVFRGADDSTRGNWLGQYGAEGFFIAEHLTNQPPWLLGSMATGKSVVWALPGLDQSRALLTADGKTRIASARWWYEGLTNQLSFRDGQAHVVSMYFLDWDRGGWQLTVTFKDAAGVILDRQTVKNFAEGRYLSWTVMGEVQIEIEKNVAFAVISGLFIDPTPAPAQAVTLTAPPPAATVELGKDLLVRADVSPPLAGGKVLFIANGQVVAESTSLPHYARWRPERIGEGLIHATAISPAGGVAFSPSIPIQVTAPPSNSAVIFRGRDDARGGNWRGFHGGDGFIIPQYQDQFSPEVDTAIIDGIPYVWDWAPSDPRALQLPTGSLRIAPAYYSETQFAIRLTPAHANWRRLTLYCLDWETAGARTQAIEIIDSAGAILDRRIVSDFAMGEYLTWDYRGPISARIVAFQRAAVVSAIFFDVLGNLDQWRADTFLNLAEPERALEKNDADPDQDGISNILEYKLGLDPLQPDPLTFVATATTHGAVRLTLRLNAQASDVKLRFLASTDLRVWEPADALVRLASIEPGQAYDWVELEVPTENRPTLFLRVSAAPAD